MAGPNFLELLFGPHLKGALSTDASSSASQFAGRTTVASGSATATVSSALVNSDSIILMGVESVGSISPIRVSSISPGNFFTVTTNDGTNAAADAQVMWLLLPTSDPN